MATVTQHPVLEVGGRRWVWRNRRYRWAGEDLRDRDAVEARYGPAVVLAFGSCWWCKADEPAKFDPAVCGRCLAGLPARAALEQEG